MKYRLVTSKNSLPIAVSEVSDNFAALLDRVRAENTEFVIEENGLTEPGPLSFRAAVNVEVGLAGGQRGATARSWS